MDKHKKGVIYIIASAFCFALMNLFIRLTGDVPTLQKCFFRNVFALMIAAASLVRAGVPFRPGKGNVKYMVIRSLTGGLGMMCNFYAVDHMDISDASMLNKLSPFFAVVFSALLLKEKANKYEWGAVIAAFTGMLFVVRPSFDIKVIPALAGVAGGLGAGIAYTFVRKLGTRGENSMIVVAFFSGFTTLLLLPNMLFNYKPMTPVQWMFLVLTGLAAAGGQIGITSAYAC
ncbi:MAG: DMT family transporter, partial [Oscillospiraceae bacterium]|nr:DMT family transporter [Oscillospiraceae bacterium]